MLLKDKTAIITGAASERGIGRATARLFAEHGARVALIDLAEQDPAAAAAELGDGHRGYVCDVSDRGQCIDTVAQAVETFGVVDILVNNAAVVQSSGIEDISAEDYELVLNVNLRGNFQMAQAVIGHMRPRKEGAIVAVSSIAGQRGGGLFGGAALFGVQGRYLRPDPRHGARVGARWHPRERHRAGADRQ
jgi:NAD(P)-dependent dehydrogenase (short-subunit alcohol dehydrogenase family)